MIESVTLCSVVYNEIDRIADLIKNASPYVDNIVIVDQQSTDGTWEWLEHNAEQMKLIIRQDRHWGYCEPSRRLAHQLIPNDSWVLVLDADERISEEFGAEMRTVDEMGFYGVRLKRAFYLGGEHRFTGDYQYRYYCNAGTTYLDEIHTEPQPTFHEDRIYSPLYPGIIHEKSWVEQIRDELAYEAIIGDAAGIEARRKRDLNVHLALLRETGITPEEADAMSIKDRNVRGIGAD